MPLKIAFIGAGSIGFTRRLMRDLLAVPEFADARFAFTDIDERNLDMVTQLCRRDIEGNNLPAKVESTLGPPRRHRGRGLRFLRHPPRRVGGVPDRHRHSA